MRGDRAAPGSDAPGGEGVNARYRAGAAPRRGTPTPGRDAPGGDARERRARQALPGPDSEQDGGFSPIPGWSSPSRSRSRGSGYSVPPHCPSPRPRTVGAAPRCSPLRCPSTPAETETKGEVPRGAQRCSPARGTSGPGGLGFKRASGRGRVYSVSFHQFRFPFLSLTEEVQPAMQSSNRKRMYT